LKKNKIDATAVEIVDITFAMENQDYMVYELSNLHKKFAVKDKGDSEKKTFNEARDKFKKDLLVKKNETPTKNQGVKFAYVVFRQTAAVDAIFQATKYSSGYRCCVNCFKSFSCCKPKYEALGKMYFMDKYWLKMSTSDQPEEINFPNIKFSRKSRTIRKCLMTLIAIAFVLAGMLGIIYFKAQSDVLKEQANTQVVCPKSTTKYEAWYDHSKIMGDRLGLMHCYCKD
jgi:hypothetical protein